MHIETFKTLRAEGVTLQAAHNVACGDAVRRYETRTIKYYPQTDKGLRWVENYKDGLRVTDQSDDGYYMTQWEEAATRPIYFQLPSRDRFNLYVAGCTDPYNDECALIDFTHTYTDSGEAYKAADRIAREYAESSQEEDLKQRTTDQLEQLTNEMAEIEQLAKDAVALLEEGARKCLSKDALHLMEIGQAYYADKYERLELQVKELESDPWAYFGR